MSTVNIASLEVTLKYEREHSLIFYCLAMIDAQVYEE